MTIKMLRLSNYCYIYGSPSFIFSKYKSKLARTSVDTESANYKQAEHWI